MSVMIIWSILVPFYVHYHHYHNNKLCIVYSNTVKNAVNFVLYLCVIKH